MAEMEYEEEDEGRCEYDDSEEDEAESIDDAGGQHPFLAYLRLASQPHSFLLLPAVLPPQQLADINQHRVRTGPGGS